MSRQHISVFDIFKIGIGPSSSHTLGPWLAILDFFDNHKANTKEIYHSLSIELFGSLALTGKGHYTDTAVCLALLGEKPETIDCSKIETLITKLEEQKVLSIFGQTTIPFDPSKDIIFNYSEQLEYHPNALKIKLASNNQSLTQTYYSTGGGFIVKESDLPREKANNILSQPPFPSKTAKDILMNAKRSNKKMSEMIWANENFWHGSKVESQLAFIWQTMADSIITGFKTTGVLPGPLKVKRRATEIFRQMLPGKTGYCIDELIDQIKQNIWTFSQTSRWVSAFALAVNEVNASLNRIVTAPTNGAAGVIPSVLLYALCFTSCKKPQEKVIQDFLLVAGEIGTLFVKEATISAAEGGCQAEIGVSSAMAAAGLTDALGGTTYQVLMAAEIAMEHHLGMTCDPIHGLVQVPCIERNAMGAIKAITATELALSRQEEDACVSLDEVIQCMWRTSQDMDKKYKETALGGLAITVNVKGC